LRRYLPALLPGLSAGGFHSLIRTAYGVRFDNETEVVDGLSYWAAAFLPLGDLPRPGALEAMKTLEAVRASTLGGRRLPGLLHEQLVAAAVLPGFADAAASMDSRACVLPNVAHLAVRIYAAAIASNAGDFTALHGVTATQAFRVLAPFVSDVEGSVRYLWQAVLAAYVAAGAPDVAHVNRRAKAPGWATIAEKASTSIDAHDLKLADIARHEDAQYHDPLYAWVAARRVKLI
jgi:hypothetical protein